MKLTEAELEQRIPSLEVRLKFNGIICEMSNELDGVKATEASAKHKLRQSISLSQYELDRSVRYQAGISLCYRIDRINNIMKELDLCWQTYMLLRVEDV